MYLLLMKFSVMYVADISLYAAKLLGAGTF